MKTSIRVKLLIVFVITLGLALSSTLLFIQWSFSRGFTYYIAEQAIHQVGDVEAALVRVYEKRNNWTLLDENPGLWSSIVMGRGSRTGGPPERRGHRRHRHRSPPDGPDGKEHKRHHGPPGVGSRAPKGLFLLDSKQSHIAGPRVPPDTFGYLKPLVTNGQTIGFLGVRLPAHLPGQVDAAFKAQQQTSYYFIGGTIFLLASLTVLPMANRLVAPVTGLAKHMRLLASGEYYHRSEHQSSDEIGQLSRDFNHLAATLEANEKSRQRWFADISHELRTPISVLKGQIEAFQEGIRKPSADNIELLGRKVEALNLLVDDLFELSLADLGALHYHKENFYIHELLEDISDSFTTAFSAKNISFRINNDLGDDQCWFGDYKRLYQLLSNLIKNSIRYTDTSGEVCLNLDCRQQSLIITIEDSKPGVSDDSLGQLFDRLFRTDPSRARNRGGAGLGLSICKVIVEAHGGTIEASHSRLGGLKVSISLPGV